MTSSLHTSPYTSEEPEAPSPNGAAVVGDLLDWYREHRRPLPWRSTRDPYCIWVSEIMLQQTQVATVVGYYERWLERFPTIVALASAEVDDVLRAWEGLGYYSRARNLQKAATRVVEAHGGELPASVEELRRLPGIGPYSAGAIASIAFGADEPAVDGNIIRVLTRLFGLRGDPKRAPLQSKLWQLARALIPAGQASDYNQALMELGATCCTPRAPRCAICPVARHCRALKSDRVLQLPEASARKVVVQERRAAAVVRRQGRVLLVRAPATAARWPGMWQFPDVTLLPEQDPGAQLESYVPRSTGVSIGAGARIGSLRHQVTRFRIDIEVYGCRALEGRARAIEYAAVSWVAPDELGKLAMPAAHRKIARSML